MYLFERDCSVQRRHQKVSDGGGILRSMSARPYEVGHTQSECFTSLQKLKLVRGGPNLPLARGCPSCTLGPAYKNQSELPSSCIYAVLALSVEKCILVGGIALLALEVM